jgi:uncharacterized protein YndB with AHSA1/START domain
MATKPTYEFDPKRDLTLERILDVPPEMVWKAWTRPEHLSQWFVPKPWHIPECEIDVRPGGTLHVEMRSPEGEGSSINGCYLEVVENQKLVWTDALQVSYRPAETPFITAVITFEPHGKGTKQTAWVMHKDPVTRKKHEDMGFYDGWGTCMDQLAELVAGWS